MIIDQHDVARITEDIWSAVAGLTVTPSPATPPGAGDRVTAGVWIVGDVEGTVTVECALPLARRAAATMFGIDPSELSDADVEDAVGELANVTGGNVKALMGGSCDLSLPWVARTADAGAPPRGHHLVEEVTFSCEGTVLVVAVFDRGSVEAGPAVVPAERN